MSKADELWMEEALREALRAQAAEEVPVGAVIVRAGEIIARGHNRSRLDSDPTAHAEIVALRDAAKALRNYRLEDCEIFVTIEPCAMCCGALVHARMARLIYGAHDPKAGAVVSVMRVLNHPQLNHSINVYGGVLARRCTQIMQEFFRKKRGE